MIVTLVPFEHIDGVWSDVTPLLQPAMHRLSGRYELDDVRRDIDSHQASLWIAADAERKIIGAAILRIVDYPKRRLGRIEVVGGRRMRAWGDALLRLIEGYAREIGCSGIEATGRHGWGRIGSMHGYHPTAVFIEKDF